MFVEAPTEQAGREGALTMHVPRGARVWLKTGSADLTVTDVTGGLDLNVVGGSITVHGSPRELRAESMDGAVTIDGTPAWMRVKTATGDITLRGGAGRRRVDDQRHDRRARRRGGSSEARVDDGHDPLRARPGTRRDGGDGDAQRPDRDPAPAEDVGGHRRGDGDGGDHERLVADESPTVGTRGAGMTLTTSGAPLGGRITVRSFKGKISIRTAPLVNASANRRASIRKNVRAIVDPRIDRSVRHHEPAVRGAISSR